MGYKSITVETEVKIDLEDIKDEVLETLDNDELIEELNARKVEFDNYPDNSNKYHILNKLYHTKDDLYRHLCDICDCGYYEPKDSLLNKLKDLM